MKSFCQSFCQDARCKFRSFVFLALLSVASINILAQSHETNAPLPAVGTSDILGKIYGIKIEAKVNAPSYQVTPLQIACVFEYVEGDIFMSPPALPADHNGMVNLDKALKGLITQLRKSGMFKGHARETLLIIPPPGTIKASKLLLIGLGDRHKFSAELMFNVGAIGMREALRLGVTSYSHASDIKDAGIDSPTGLVAASVVKGALEAYKTQMYLKRNKADKFIPLTKFTLLSGQAYYVPSGQAIKEALTNFSE